MTNKQILVALSVALIAAPAAAKGEPKSGKEATTAVDQKKYCISYDNVVGSRVTRTQCLTKDEWKKQRVDVDKMLNQ
ncbi:hypothetical protein [Sphingomonas daechungensis]|uniref:hypothetical protein n=1 Tax=Sphingomonas daechungensis TaxID=1176646 RepID=UPI003783CFEE